MKKGKNYILQKTSKYALCTILVLSLLQGSKTIIDSRVEYTKEDIINNKTYISKLIDIEREEPYFHNQDLKQELLNQNIDLTKENLKNINSIKITNRLLNNNFADLKYFPNLTTLEIENNDIDLNDLYYNYNLLDLKINNSIVTNTISLPNSIYNINLQNTIVKDDIFIIPYNTKYINIIDSPFNNFNLKNPSQLTKLSIVGNAYIDLSCLKECTNLNTITLNRIPNVKSPEILTTLDCLNTINLDDYAPIWLNLDIFNSLKIDNMSIYNEINQLDNLASTLTMNDNTEEEKIKSISKFILERLSYDNEITDEDLKYYNDTPIYSSLNSTDALCINYASLFTALANRVGIETFQIYSPNHTWNMTTINNESTCIDLTMLDTKTIVNTLESLSEETIELTDTSSLELIKNNEEDSLYHYKITLDELVNDPNLSNYTLLPNQEIAIISNNIGFVKVDGIPIEHNNKLYVLKYSSLQILTFLICLFTSTINLIRTKKRYNKL